MKRILLVSRNNDGTGYRYLAFSKKGEKIQSKPLLISGTPLSLSDILSKNEMDEVYLDLPYLTPEEMFHIREECKGVHELHFISNLYQNLSRKVPLKEINGIPLMTMKEKKRSRFYKLVKRGMDLFGALLGLLFFAPLFGIISLLIKSSMRGPILFSQKRLGMEGKSFIFYKFRTMNENGENPHREFVANFIRNRVSLQSPFKLQEDPRITRLGYFLRRTSLDELPQLYNVLKGEMSLIGPRPAIPYELEHYEEWHKRRLTVKPGMTGIWQVSGRSSVSFNDMVLMDLFYIDNQTLWFDIVLILKTLPAVISKKGAF